MGLVFEVVAEVFRSDAKYHIFSDVPTRQVLKPSPQRNDQNILIGVFSESQDPIALVYLALKQVHGRAADEAGHENVLRLSIEVSGSATCMILPSRMTQIRSPIVMASTWSWVT